MQLLSKLKLSGAPFQAAIQAASGTTITPNGLNNIVNVAQLSATTTIAAPTATPADGDTILFRFADPNGQTITWNAIYLFGLDIPSSAVPTTAAKQFELLVRYDSAVSKWRVVGISREAGGATGGGGSTSPGGSTTQVQFNDGGAFGGDAGFTYNKTTDQAIVGILDTGGAVYNVKAYGAFGDGSSHPLSGVFGTLGAAQVVYPTAQSLTDEYDQVATEKALASIPANGGIVLMPAGTYRFTRTLVIGDGSATNVSTRRGQHLIGAGAGATHSEMTPLMSGTKIQWYGAADGRIIWVKGPTSGIEISGIMFECTPVATAAGTAIYQSHVMDSVLSDVAAVQYSGEAFVLEAYPYPTDSTYGCVQGASGNIWRGVRAYVGEVNSIGIRLGTIDSVANPNTGALELDVNANIFIGCDLRTLSTTSGSVGLQLSFCDNNTFIGCWFDAESAIRIAPPSTAVLVAGVVTGNPTVTAGGVNYSSQVTATFKGGGGSGATATTSMGFGNAIITSAGTGYANGTYTLGIAGGGGTGATGTYTIAGGILTTITITAAGTGYTSQPTLSFPSGGGSGAAATAYLKLVSLTLTAGGTGYKYRPSVVITGGGLGYGAYAGANYWPQSNTFVNCPSTSYLEEDGWTGTPDLANFFMPWQSGDLEPVPSPQALSFQAFTFGGLTLGDWKVANTYNNAPKDAVATPSTASGSIAAGTYYFMIVAYDGQGFSLPSADARAVLSGTGKIALTWKSVVGATAYRIYKGTAPYRTGKTLYTVSTDTYYEWTTDAGATTVQATDLPLISPQTANFKLYRDTGGWITGKLGINRSDPSYAVDIRGGGLRVDRLAETVAPVITNIGTAGATTYSYYVVVEDYTGKRSMPSPVGTTTTGNAALSTTNYNRIETVPVGGAKKYYVLKKSTAPTVGGTENILLATIVVGTDSTFVFDTGQTLTSFTNATKNTTGDSLVNGALQILPANEQAHNSLGVGTYLAYDRSNDYQQIVGAFLAQSSVASGTYTWDLSAARYRIQHVGAGNSTTLYGLQVQAGVGSAGGVVTMEALRVTVPYQWDVVTPTGVITNAYGIRTTAAGPGGTSVAISNYYGFYSDTPTTLSGVTVVNNWGFYAPSALQDHFLAGNLSVKHMMMAKGQMRHYDSVTSAAATLATLAGIARTVTSSVAATNQKNARGEWLRISATTTGAISSLISATFTLTQLQLSGIAATKVEHATAITNRRIFIGLVSAAVPAAETLATISAVAFRYSTGSSDTTWKCVTSNGTTQTVADSGVTVAADTVYELKIDYSSATSIRFYINGTLVATMTATLPAATTNLTIAHHLTSLTNTGQKDLDVAWTSVDHP